MLASSQNPSMVGQPVTYTAVVASQSGVTATGSITFAINLHKPVVVPLVNGQAAYTIAYELAGPRTVTADYSGDAGHLSSTSATLDQTINKQPTQTTLTSSLNPSSAGQPVIFTATVVGQYGATPTGSVTFNISLSKPAIVSLTNGVATYMWTFKMSGSRTVTANYSGDNNNQASVNPTINQTINP